MAFAIVPRRIRRIASSPHSEIEDLVVADEFTILVLKSVSGAQGSQSFRGLKTGERHARMERWHYGTT
jgi:hypothetical protein